MLKLLGDEHAPLICCGYYSKKIEMYLSAYGTAYDFCRFYSDMNGGYVMLYNSLAVCSGRLDCEELDEFLSVFCPVSVELPRELSDKLTADGYTRKHRTMFKMQGEGGTSPEVCTDYKRAYEILCDGFSMSPSDFGAWYTDISHRIRRGLSLVYLNDNHSTATVQFASDGFAFVSHIATASEYRGKGYARQLLYGLTDKLASDGLTGHLFALDHRRSYYEGIGFVPIQEDYLLEID